MSTDYNKEIFSNDQSTLQINFSGIKNGIATVDSLKMSIYAYESATGKALFNETLSFKQIQALYEHLNQVSIIRDSSAETSGKFIEATEGVATLINKIQKIDSEALATILDTLETDEKVVALLKSLSDVELDNMSAAHKQQAYKKESENLLELLELEKDNDIVKEILTHKNLSAYIAKQPEKIFQNWIERNLWVFGVEYAQHYDARKIALFSESDLLMESLDGYLDLIELKRPKLSYELFSYDESHKCYYPSSALSQVIGQSLFYLQKMDDYKLVLEKEHKVKILNPRIKIIAGRTCDFNEDQYHALRMLNSNLNNIQVYSYDYIVSSAAKVLSNYE